MDEQAVAVKFRPIPSSLLNGLAGWVSLCQVVKRTVHDPVSMTAGVVRQSIGSAHSYQ